MVWILHSLSNHLSIEGNLACSQFVAIQIKLLLRFHISICINMNLFFSVQLLGGIIVVCLVF